MNRDETIKIMGIIRSVYPSFHANSAAEDIETAIGVWQSMFDSDPFHEVQAATKAFIASDSKGFPPHIGAIKEQLVRLREGGKGEMTEMEAWAHVKRALKNGYYGYEKEFEKLPDVVKGCIGDPKMLRDWSQMETEVVDSVVASNFMRSYRVRANHVREALKMPDDVKKLFASVREVLKLPEANVESIVAKPIEHGEPVPMPDWFKEKLVNEIGYGE